MKRCPRCGEMKSLDDFYVRRESGRQPRPTNACRVCVRTKARFHLLRRKYGLSFEEVEAMLDRQDGLCAICHRLPTPENPIVIDHDHESGRTRGLLCRLCNLGLGYFQDEPERLQEAIRYLAAHAASHFDPVKVS